MMGGQATPGVGWGCGAERLILAMDAESIAAPKLEQPLVYVVPLDADSLIYAQGVARAVRSVGISLAGYKVKGMGKALADAEKAGAKYAVVVGSNERETGVLSVRTLETRESTSVRFEDLPAWLEAELHFKT